MATKAAQFWSDSSIAEKYLIAENATRPFAKDMVKSVGLDHLDGDAHVFDFACGTGALTKELYGLTPKEKWNNLKILGGDVSIPMLESLKESGEKEGWTGLKTEVVDANVSDCSSFNLL
jgi:ubiquinone/menaquinone biosynthesis C-methylase UbiE